MRSFIRHWVEPLQVLEKIGSPEGIRSFAEHGNESGFSRQDTVELYATFFEDRLAEALALGVAAGEWPGNGEFAHRLSDILLAPQRLFESTSAGTQVFPVDEQFLYCFREAVIAIEGAFFRFCEGDYAEGQSVSSLLRQADEAVSDENNGRAFDRLTLAGARVLEGAYLAKPTEWMVADPLYSWLLGLERIAYVVARLQGWPRRRRVDWPDHADVELVWQVEMPQTAIMNPARREVLQLLRNERFADEELSRMRRNRRWLGPELQRLLHIADEHTTPRLLQNVVRTIGAVGYRPAVDDVFGLMMRTGLNHGRSNELVHACEDSLARFGADISEELLFHSELALADTQRVSLLRLLLVLPMEKKVLEALHRLIRGITDESIRIEAYEMVADTRHEDVRELLMTELREADSCGQTTASFHLRRLLRRSTFRV